MGQGVRVYRRWILKALPVAIAAGPASLRVCCWLWAASAEGGLVGHWRCVGYRRWADLAAATAAQFFEPTLSPWLGGGAEWRGVEVVVVRRGGWWVVLNPLYRCCHAAMFPEAAEVSIFLPLDDQSDARKNKTMVTKFMFSFLFFSLSSSRNP